MRCILAVQDKTFSSPKTHYMSANEASRTVVGFLDVFIDVFLEVQHKNMVKYCM